MKKIYAAAAQKKVADSLLNIAQREIAELKNQISILSDKDAELKVQYQNQISNLLSQTGLYKDQINGYEKLLRREKRKRKAATAAGITVAGILTYLLVTK